MSLNWNISHCADMDAIKADTPDGWPVTDCIIWLTMIVGINEITEEKAAEEFWHRVYAWETCTDPINLNGRRIEPRDITRRVGLRTNATPITDAAWRIKLVKAMRTESEATWRRTKGGIITRAEADKKPSAGKV